MLPTENYEEHMNEPAFRYARTDLPLLNQTLTVGEALDYILESGTGEKIIYFYVVDEEKHLLGVIPTRRLLTTPRNKKITEIMIPKIFKLHRNSTVLEACESFVLYRFLALPIVDEENRILGMVDINLFTEEIIHMNTRGELDQFFETIGFRYKDVSTASPVTAFKYRFPWLLATITSGLVAAFISGMFDTTLEQSILLAFFLTLLLGMGESVSIQSMTLALHIFGIERPTKSWIGKSLVRELASTFLLGVGGGAITGIFVFLWQGLVPELLIVSVSIVLVVVAASAVGFLIPTVIHKFSNDPRVAAGPLTLATADIFTILIYLGLATAVLR